ncbi:MAG: hypothetical protein AAF414_11630 [Pseudomonadota bacterium]
MTSFPEQLPHGDLTEVLPDIFFVSGQSRPDFNGQTFQFSRNMTVIRDRDGLTLVNTLRLDEDGLASLDSLGTVRNVVRLGAFHGRDDAFYLNRYGVPFWACPGVDFQRGETIDSPLADGEPGPSPDSSVFIFQTVSVPEAILRLDRQGGVLVASDSLQNWVEPDEFFDEASAKSMKEFGFFHPANVGPGWRNAAQPQVSDFERLKTLDFKHLLSAHGTPLLNDAYSGVSATLEDLYGV